MSIGIKRRLAHLFHQFNHSGILGQAGAHNQRVDKEADQPLYLGLGATGDRRADQDLALAAVAVEQQRIGTEQGHKGGSFMLLAKVNDLTRRPRIHREFQGFAAKALLRGPRPVGGQFEQGRRAAQFFFPVGSLLLQQPTLQPLALPERIVGILHRQARQGGGFTTNAGAVKGGEFFNQQPNREPITDDVVHVENQIMFGQCRRHRRGRGKAQQQHTQQWPFGEIKGAADLIIGHAQCTFGLGDIDDRNRHRGGRRNPLVDLARLFDKGRA